jgi:c-di-GMP-binding flagellar brake protein YcgR
MIPETIDALIRAGADALQTTCGLTVTAAHVSLVQQGSLTFPSLGELRIRNGALQKVNLGCDTVLVGQLADRNGAAGRRSGIEVLAARVLSNLIEEMEGRRPRGTVENLAVAPITLFTRGRRTFGIRLETHAGRLFMMAEIPSKIELEAAKNSDFISGMIGTYMPRDWVTRERLQSGGVIDNFLVFVRKVEADLYLEAPDSCDEVGMHGAILLGAGTMDGCRALKLCVDLADTDLTTPSRGDTFRATVGLEDRSFSFDLSYLGEADQPLTAGARLPCAWFAVPDNIAISQRRRSFRLPPPEFVMAELECVAGVCLDSPWGDREQTRPRSNGQVKDLSFDGARIVLPQSADDPALELGNRVRCHLHLPGEEQPLVISALIRRVTLSLADRNEWQRDVGLEFQVTGSADRAAANRIREFVLDIQRLRLARRIDFTGTRSM